MANPAPIQEQTLLIDSAALSNSRRAVIPSLSTFIPSCFNPVFNAVLLVLGLHIAVLLILFYRSSSDNEIITALPTISGTLIKADPTPISPVPKAKPKLKQKSKPIPKLKPIPKPILKPIPKPIPKPKPSSKLKLKPKAVLPPPVPIRQTSEKAITQPEPITDELSQSSTDQPIGGPKYPVSAPRLDASRSKNPAPVYPRTSQRLRQEGTVILTLLIRPDGTVAEVDVKVSSGHSRLDKAAVKAVKRWRYLPAKQGNRTIEFWYEQPIVFALRK
ncbi:MAG: energy transducer TonB [Pseudomonadales bacterium]|nr:energy transducer TonB [Pseudomonadales bacterium]